MGILGSLSSGWVKGLISVAVALVKQLKGASYKPTLSELAPQLLGNLIPAVDGAIKYQNLDSLKKVEAWGKQVDKVTGVEETALDVIPDMPPELEEKFFDGMVMAGTAYAEFKVRKNRGEYDSK